MRALRRDGSSEVRAYLDATVGTDDDARALREQGCKVAVGDLDDEGLLETALTGAHTVVDVGAGPLADPGEQLDGVATTVSAAIGAGCRRLVWVTELADPRGNAYLEALADAEEMIADAPLETVVFRCGLRYGRDDELTRALCAADLSGADASTMHAPLALDDLGDALAAADRQRGTQADLHVAVELVGPDEIRLGSYIDRLRAALGVSPPPPGTGQVPERVLDWLSRPAVGGAEALGRTGRSLAAVLG